MAKVPDADAGDASAALSVGLERPLCAVPHERPVGCCRRADAVDAHQRFCQHVAAATASRTQAEGRQILLRPQTHHRLDAVEHRLRIVRFDDDVRRRHSRVVGIMAVDGEQRVEELLGDVVLLYPHLGGIASEVGLRTAAATATGSADHALYLVTIDCLHNLRAKHCYGFTAFRAARALPRRRASYD